MRRYAKSGAQWLARVDGNSVLSRAEWKAHVEAEYGITVTEVIDTADDVDPRSGAILAPTPRPAPPDPKVALRQRVRDATTLADLKSVLLDILV